MTSRQNEEECTENGAALLEDETMDSDADERSEEQDWQVLVVKGTAKRPLEPRQGFDWDDRAIVDCFQCAVDSHVGSKQQEWIPPPAKDKWKPKPIPLPSWAIDPLLQLDNKEKAM
jgi:hypothetical protein